MLAFINKDPQSCEAIAKHMKIKTPLAGYYLKHLKNEGKVKAVGQGNATKYVRT